MRPSEGGMHTSTLWRQLFKSPSLTEYLEKSDSQAEPLSFSAYIRELCQQRGEIPERVIKRSNIERSYGHSLFRGDRKPSRDTVLQLAFGFGADIETAQALLKHAGHSQLYPRVRRDAVISYCLLHGHTIAEAQQMLAEFKLPSIGGGTK